MAIASPVLAAPMSQSGPSVGEKRRESGRAHFTKVLTLMLANVSHPEMAALADWATNEPGCLHTSQLSHLRNAKMRMLGVKSLDALGRINQCSDAFKNDRATYKTMGTAQATAKIEEILERYESVFHPDTGAPLNAGDLMMIYLGYLELDLPGASPEQEKRWSEAADKLGKFYEDLIEQRGIRFSDSRTEVQNNWTGTDAQLTKFISAVAGIADYSSEDLSDAWPAITKAIAVLMDEEVSEEDLLEMVLA